MAWTETLKGWALKRGCSVTWGSLENLRRVRRELSARRTSGELDESLYEAELRPMVEASDWPGARAVVLVARSSRASRLSFETKDGCAEALLPPTYTHYRASFEELRQDLETHGLPGARVEHLVAPLKALAAALGIVKYGRNNIAYTEEFGSYMQLYGYLTDAALEEEGPRAVRPQMLPQCESCGACLAACPTGAIGEDRLLLRAERCLTYANENPGPWPDWVPRGAHNALLGCLACQRACPANPELPVDEVGVRFTRGETAALLAEGSPGEKRSETGFRTKLAWLGRPDAEDILARNLRALLDRAL
jgi:epoxyqueuosine reductase